MADRNGFSVPGLSEVQTDISLTENFTKTKNMMTVILFLTCLICFVIFFKSIDFFENI